MPPNPYDNIKIPVNPYRNTAHGSQKKRTNFCIFFYLYFPPKDQIKNMVFLHFRKVEKIGQGWRKS